MKKKIVLLAGAAGAILAGVVMMTAFEGHVVNVTAKIENALDVPVTELEFGTVFPEEVLYKDMIVQLSESFMGQAGCSDVNLIANGGFEAPIVTDAAQWDIFPDDTPGLGWTVEWRGDIPAYWPNPTQWDRPDPALKELHHGVLGPAFEGFQYAELDTDWYGPGHPQNGEPASVKIYQDIPTTAGNKYQLSFAFSPRPNTAADNNKLEVKWDGVVEDTIGPVAGVGSNNWTVYTYEVTASSNMTRVEFTDLGTADSLGTFLDDVKLVECGRVNTVDYVVRQKPKCVAEDGSHPQVMHEGDTFRCPAESEMMPLLCPYLSKSEETEDGEGPENDGDPILAFHGPLTGWTMVNTLAHQVAGRLSASVGDIMDEWLIDLHVPCFEGYCAQDDVIPPEYEADPALESEVFGCDLWIEVVGINGNDLCGGDVHCLE